MPVPAKKNTVEVWSFDTVERAQIIDILSRHPIADKGYVELKPHVDYLVDYCNAIGVKTIVVEPEYVDRDFLEDFAGYYVRCFADYSSTCARLHFFNFKFTRRQLNGCLLGKAPKLKDRLQQRDNYLGFVVIKPLPRTIVGRTCLQAYPENGRRHFVKRDYKVNLYGIELVTRGTLAFQEQDHAAAACATSALWSAFQGTSIVFNHHIPSPVEITKAALSRFPMAERGLPNSGLHDIQIANGIRSVGLDPVPFNIDPHKVSEAILTIQDITYAYLKCGIPALLGVRLLGLPDNPGHAVAVTGFSLGLAAPTPRGKTGFLLRSSRIDKIYAHDDGIGPFARMALQTPGSTGPGSLMLTTNWRDEKGILGNVFAIPDIILVPVYHKVRIPYNSVLESVISFDAWIEELAKKHFKLFSERLEWDIYLTTVNDLKIEIERDLPIRGAYRKAVLQQPMPRFMWRATARVQGQPVLDLLFDATDIDQGSFFTRAIEYDCGLAYSHVLRVLAKLPAFTNKSKADPLWVVLSWFAKM